ncbi:MAG: saccharopine dehydrogenase NADP-binding domain-containing protein [Bacillota bacterium]
MKDSILIIGGYGKVGTVIARYLNATEKYHVTIAGRDGIRALKAAEQIGNTVSSLEFDISDHQEYEIKIKNYDAVVVCIDQNNTKLVEFCLSKSIYYFDVTASPTFFSSVEQLDNFAKANKATGVLSMGLCPGLTNLMTRKIIESESTIQEVNIGILLGLGEKHGRAAIEWLIDNLINDYWITYNTRKIRIKPFRDPAKIKFLPTLGKRTCYRLNFSDQHSLKKTYKEKEIATRLCFDSRFITLVLHWACRIGIVKSLKKAKYKEKVVGIAEKLHVGSDIFAVSVEGKCGTKNLNSISVAGNSESYITGKIAFGIIDIILSKENREYGIYHTHELIELDDILPYIENDVKVHI